MKKQQESSMKKLARLGGLVMKLNTKMEETSAEALQDRAGDKLSDAIEKLINTRATTIEGLRCKARLVKMMDSQDHEIMLSLVDDLTEVQS